jgi:hypothetical protein
MSSNSAGGTGFEPAIRFNPDNRLAGGPIRPLWHPPMVLLLSCKGGGSGIRTHGNAERYVGFQDQCLKPLGHPSRWFGQVSAVYHRPPARSILAQCF